MQVVYEDNHIIIVYKESGEIVQGDKTGDEPLSERVKAYIKKKYAKPGDVFLGVVHRDFCIFLRIGHVFVLIGINSCIISDVGQILVAQCHELRK